MPGKIEGLFEVRTIYALLSDDEAGPQVMLLGLLPGMEGGPRIIVLQKSSVDKAQGGTSPFAALPRNLEREVIARVAPDLAPKVEERIQKEAVQEEVLRRGGIPAQVRGK